jgi:hypothetical protein
MESFDSGVSGAPARVVTLDAGEQFALSAPGQDDPVRVSTVTAFGAGPGTRVPYFTVAGESVLTGEFGELEHEFTDSGVLPPHVREVVEPLVPVVDTPAVVRGFPGHRGGNAERDTRWGGYSDEHPHAVEPRTSLAQLQRRAEFEEVERKRWAARSPESAVAMEAKVVRFPVSPVSAYRSRL